MSWSISYNPVRILRVSKAYLIVKYYYSSENQKLPSCQTITTTADNNNKKTQMKICGARNFYCIPTLSYVACYVICMLYK